ncbi:RNA polymerase sigma factor [Steroidobacter sp.]|uniref:RNA polymerase sigma factor n=1 Tax=Steroidobacter sp. TaxID=1978227 RepID=UPI001A53A7FF|nr:sigma-70 family RNA polymerase sigma factor [Steroidobacter sp.]MBL8268639.1 sigma-70 family RNA polymerase sigma factor [Steroidobacter sp.]
MATEPDGNVQHQRKILINALYRRYQRALVRFLTRQRFSREEAADIVHDAYVRMHQVPDVAGIEYPQAFLYRLVSNLARNDEKHRRYIRGQGTVDVQSVDVPTDAPGPHRLLQGQQELALVRQAFNELSPKCRRAFAMHRFDGCSYAEIARELGVSVSMIEKYISQALTHLKGRLAVAGPQPEARLRLLK